jgi:hypothetical protein
MEQSFPGYLVKERVHLGKRLLSTDEEELSFDFEGVGIVLTGRVRSIGHDDKYALLSPGETVGDYQLKADFMLDGVFTKSMELPLSFIERAHELYFQYEIPKGIHRLTFRINNPHDKVYLQIDDMIVYDKKD